MSASTNSPTLSFLCQDMKSKEPRLQTELYRKSESMTVTWNLFFVSYILNRLKPNAFKRGQPNASRFHAQSNVIWNVLISLGHIYNYKPYLVKEKCCRNKKNKEILPVWPRLVLNSSSSTANIIPELLFCPPMISITIKPTIQAVHEQPSSKRAFTE